MPGYIAWVYVYSMASKLAQADGEFIRWNEEGFRQTYYEKLVAGVDTVIQDIKEEPEPQIHEFADEEGEEPSEPESTKAPEPVSHVKPMAAKVKASDGQSAKA